MGLSTLLEQAEIEDPQSPGLLGELTSCIAPKSTLLSSDYCVHSYGAILCILYFYNLDQKFEGALETYISYPVPFHLINYHLARIINVLLLL